MKGTILVTLNNDFEGTLILEQMARIDKLDEFMAAIDSQDVETVKHLLQTAGITQDEIDIVLQKMSDPYDEP